MHFTALRITLVCFVAACGGLSRAQTTNDAEAITQRRDLQNLWEIDPDLGTNWTESNQDDSIEVSLPALQAPDLDARVAAMRSLVVQARHHPIRNRSEALAAVREQLQQDLSNNESRHAILAVLSAAATLSDSSEDIASLGEMVADKKYAIEALQRRMIELSCPLPVTFWRERLSARTATDAQLLTAMEGLTMAGEDVDRGLIEPLVADANQSAVLRFAAAKLLGSQVDSGLNDLASQLISGGGSNRFNLAAALLQQHGDEGSIAILDQALAEGDSQAQALAFRAIAQHDPARGIELGKELIESGEPLLRSTVVEVLNGMDTVDAARFQALALDDPMMEIREQVRSNLESRADEPGMSTLLDRISSHFLAAEDWHGIEQAIKLSVSQQQNNRANAFGRLLNHPQPEVFIRAAWGLQQLELTPETLHAIHQFCLKPTATLANDGTISFEQELQLAFLFEALGKHRYEPASEMLLQYVPRDGQRMRPLPRASAIYALGLIWEGKDNEDLFQALLERAQDDLEQITEVTIVRYVSLLGLGRINGPSSVAQDIKDLGLQPPDLLGYAAQWAIERLTNSEDPS